MPGLNLPDGGSGLSGGWSRFWATIFVVCALACSPVLILIALVDAYVPRLTEGTLLSRTLYRMCGRTLVCRVTVRMFPIIQDVFRRVRFCWPAAHFSGDDRRPLAITIDDSPGNDPQSFEDILRVLREAEVTATFFVTSALVSNDELESVASVGDEQKEKERMAGLLQQAVTEGHELAHHMGEDRAYGGLPGETFVQCVETTEATLARFDGGRGAKAGRWWRPPSASLTHPMCDALESRGYRLCMGDLYSNDVWIDAPTQRGGVRTPCPRTIDYHVAFLIDQARPGSVMILHSAKRDERGTLWRGKTADILARALPKLAARGFECGSLSALQDAADRAPLPCHYQRLGARLRRALGGGASEGYPWAARASPPPCPSQPAVAKEETPTTTTTSVVLIS